MPTGANFKETDGRVFWYRPLILGDELLTQDHEARMHVRQRSYGLFPEYGNPFVETLTSEISETERNMLLVSETKECAVQDPRIVDAVVDESSIVDDGIAINFRYEITKADGGILEQEFSSDLT